MKKFLYLSFLLFASFSSFSQCISSLINDPFSSVAPEWTFTGDQVYQQGQQVLLDNPTGEDDNRMLRALPRTISNDYFLVDLDFSILAPNTSGHGVTATLFALTASNEEFAEAPNGNGYLETDQNGIALLVTSAGYMDNDIDNWFFIPEMKVGNSRTWDMNDVIYLSSDISNYYIRFERTSSTSGTYSVFSDADRTIHVQGSPQTFTINMDLVDLNYTQHGGFTSANISRTISASLDNLVICDNIEPALLEEQQKSTMFIYPNPGEGTILFAEGYHPVQGTVTDISGKIVQEFGKTVSLDLSGLTNGTYYVSVLLENGERRTLNYHLQE